MESNFTLIYTGDELDHIIAEWNNVVSNLFLDINTFAGYFSNHTLYKQCYLKYRDKNLENMHTHIHLYLDLKV